MLRSIVKALLCSRLFVILPLEHLARCAERMMKRNLAIFVLAGLAAISFGQASTSGQKHLKLRIAVAPLDYGTFQYIDQWQIPVEFRNAIDEKLASKLFDTGRFIVLEREAMEPLLQEKAIKEDNTGQSQKGKIIPAQALIRAKLTDFSIARRGSGIGVNVGSIGRIGGNVTQAQAAVNLTIFDVDTSALMATADASGKAQSSSFKLQSGARFGFADFSTFENSPLGDAMNKALDDGCEDPRKAWQFAVERPRGRLRCRFERSHDQRGHGYWRSSGRHVRRDARGQGDQGPGHRRDPWREDVEDRSSEDQGRSEEVCGGGFDRGHRPGGRGRRFRTEVRSVQASK